MQRLVGGFEEAFDPARGLADALLILGEGEAHVIVAVFAAAHAARAKAKTAIDTKTNLTPPTAPVVKAVAEKTAT